MPIHKPINEKQIEDYMEEERNKFIWPNADYPAVIVETKETQSKSKDDMWVIKSKLTNRDLTSTITSWYVFKKEPNIDDYKSYDGTLVGSDKERYNKDVKTYMFCIKKIRDLFEAVGKIDYYENNKINGENVIEDIALRGCRYIARTKIVSDDRGEKMIINECIKPDIIDDEIPF